MDIDNLSGVPDWDDDRFRTGDDESEEWKREEKNELATTCTISGKQCWFCCSAYMTA
jgi:hypothetical protein